MTRIIIGLLAVFLLSMAVACAEKTAPASPEVMEPVPFPPPTQSPPRPHGHIYTEPAETIVIDIGDRFTIGLDVVLRLGAKWQANYNESMLAALSDDYYVDDDSESPGLSGTQYFQFRALKSGTTQVECSLQHGTTGPVSERKVFSVQIIGAPTKEPPKPAAWWPAPVTEGILIEMYTRTTMAGVARHLTILADGEILYIEETGLRMPTKEYPTIRTTRSGLLTEAELASLLEMVDACPFDAEGNCDARTEIIDTDATNELTIYYQGKTRVITADYQPLFHPFLPKSPELMDVPESVRELYRQLKGIIDNNTSQVSEEAISKTE
jgi:predicted secreted protein